VPVKELRHRADHIY